MTSQLVTKHSLLEELNNFCEELLEKKQEKDAVHIKKEVCQLNDQWDKLYADLKLREKSSQNILALWYSYVDRMSSRRNSVGQ